MNHQYKGALRRRTGASGLAVLLRCIALSALVASLAIIFLGSRSPLFFFAALVFWIYGFLYAALPLLRDKLLMFDVFATAAAIVVLGLIIHQWP